MKLSYVVTSYNNGAYLRDCVSSLLAQTHPADEILILDDASTDGSPDILQELESANNSIRVQVRSENVGAGRNRHEGFLTANGPLVTNLAGDDTVHSDKLLNEYTLITEHNADLAFSDVELVYPTGERYRVSTDYFAGLETASERVTAMLTRKRPLPHHMLYDQSIYKEVGGYDTTATLYEDWSLKLRLAATDRKWHHTGRIGLHYNLHGNGLSASAGILHSYWRLYVIGRNFEWLSALVSIDAVLTGCKVAFDPWKNEQRPAFRSLRQAWLNFLEREGNQHSLLRQIFEGLQMLVQTRANLKITENEAKTQLHDALIVAMAHRPH